MSTVTAEQPAAFFSVFFKRLRENVEALGAYGNMIFEVGRDIIRHGINVPELSRQIVKMGSNSIPIVILTAGFTGMVLALQTAYGLHRFGAKNYVGNVVGLGLVRELGPVLTAVMLAGRVGAGIAAEIASMVATEQVDAIRKLVSPRIVAALIVLPLLAVIANLVGMWGGAMVAVYELDLTAHRYYRSLMYTLVIRDVFDGLFKSMCFGFFMVSIACFKGLRTRGGTEGVGLTTTSAVVTASIVIFVSDFFITKLLILLS